MQVISDFARPIRDRDGHAPAGTPILTVYPMDPAWPPAVASAWASNGRRLGKSQARGSHPQNPRRAALENNDSSCRSRR